MDITLAICLAVSAHCLWTRRATWPSHWDGPATNSIVLLTVDVIMMTPGINMRISPYLYRWFGTWNLEQLFGHICYVGALMGFITMAAFRLKMTDRARQRFLHRNITLTGSLVIPLMVALFVWGGGEGANIEDLVLDSPSEKMLPYWILLRTANLYLTIILTVIIWELRKNPAARSSCNLYLIGCALSLCGPTLGLIRVFGDISAAQLNWAIIRVDLLMFAAAATWSWRRRVRNLRGKRTTTGQEPQPA